MSFFPMWKRLGDKAFDLINIEVADEVEAEDFLSKLIMIDDYAPRIAQSIHSLQEAKTELERAKKQPNRAARRKQRNGQSPSNH